MNDYNPDSINSIVLLTEFARDKIEGPFDFLRDGGQFEATIPHSALDERNIHPEDVGNFEGGTAVALADGQIVGHGEVVGMDAHPDEPEVLLAVDDPLHADASEIDVDVEELRESTA